MKLRYLLVALVALGLSVPTFARDEEPLRAEDAYRYVVFDAGDALEIDWSIEDGYYLYKEKLAFVSNTDGVSLGRPELPRGEDHEDEFFGKQEIYRDRFFVSIPYGVSGERPETMDLVLKLQGCAEDWFCHPPQSWTETVELSRASSAKPKLELGNVGGLGGDFLPVDEAFAPVIIPVDGNTVEVSFRIADEYYLYKDKIKVTTTSSDAQLGRLALPKGKLKVDEFFGEQEVFYQEVFATLPIARATPESMDLDIEVEFQGCADAGLCYPPTSRTLTVSLPEGTAGGALPAVRTSDEPVTEQARLARIIQTSSIWVAAGVFFLAGLGLAFTPCVLPMVPILSGIIAGEGDDVSPMRGFTLALSYVMGMALVYTAAGIAAAAAGAQLQAMFNQPWVLILFAALFVALAFAMFGAYDLQMPSGIQSRLASVSGKQKSGTMIGAFIMGALSSLVVTACVAPALIAALTVMAQSQDWVRGGVALFAMSLGMGAPLLAVGAAQGKLLPKAGPWMVAIKGAFGFMMLGLAIWMLGRILPGSVTMTLWAALVFMGGVFMGGLTTLTPESSVPQKLGKGLGLLAILYGIVLFLGAMTGGSNPLRPLASIDFGAGGVMVAEEQHLEFQRIKTVADLDREIALAARAGKTAMLDFYADWCVSCIEMEEYTFTEQVVHDVLANSVLLQADVTANDEQDQELLQRFGVFGPPTIIFFNDQGVQVQGYEVVGFMNAEDFAAHIEKTFAAGQQLTARLD
jgi:thiol:disulfide interchange protein DsbD